MLAAQLFFTLFLTLVPSCPAPAAAQDAAAHFAKAQQLSDNGDTAGAIAEYRQGLRLDPNNAEAHNGLGKALRDKKDFEGAMAEFKKALQLKPDYAEAHFNIGVIHIVKGDYDGAMAEYKETLRLDPSLSAAHNNLGLMLWFKHNDDAAITEFREAIRLQPEDVSPRINLGRVLTKQKKYDAAISELREAVRLKPNNAEARDELVGALFLKEDTEGAMAELRELSRLSPSDAAGYYFGRGNRFRENEKYADAIAAYKEAIRLKPDFAGAHNDLAWLYATATDPAFRDPEAALRYAKTAIELSGGKRAAFFDTLAEAYFVNGRYAEAVQTEKQALALDPDNDDFKKSLQRFQKALQKKSG
jgi:superkiller protein 3